MIIYLLIKGFDVVLYGLVALIPTFETTSSDKTTMALLYAVQSGYPLKDLTRSYRTKIKSLLEGGSLIKFDTNSATNSFTQLIYSYFVKRNSKQIFF